MAVAKILWVDDEIESLQSQKLFLEGKGYEVQTLTNGFDAIDYVKENPVDVVLIDETMPGITGLETLAKIKEVNGSLPVVLITKNETNTEFFKFVSRNYASWINPKSGNGPVMSHNMFQFKVLPHVEKGTPLFFILIDNLRFDQWKAIQPIFAESFRILEEDTFY